MSENKAKQFIALIAVQSQFESACKRTEDECITYCVIEPTSTSAWLQEHYNPNFVTKHSPK